MKSSAAVSSHLRRNATYEDCSAILECLRPAFAPYRESYTPEAFLDTVLTPETLAIRGWTAMRRRCPSPPSKTLQAMVPTTSPDVSVATKTDISDRRWQRIRREHLPP